MQEKKITNFVKFFIILWSRRNVTHAKKRNYFRMYGLAKKPKLKKITFLLLLLLFFLREVSASDWPRGERCSSFLLDLTLARSRPQRRIKRNKFLFGFVGERTSLSYLRKHRDDGDDATEKKPQETATLQPVSWLRQMFRELSTNRLSDNN